MLIRQLSPQDILHHLPALTALLCDVVDNGAAVNFIAPMPPADAEAFWRGVAAGVAQQTRIVLTAMDDEALLGSVQLALAWQPNGPHRAEVQKLLVHSNQRRRGIATQMMHAAEEAARQRGRWLLFLDTERDSDAVRFYEKMGYQRAGIIEQFALDSSGKTFIDTVIFYKVCKGA